MSDLLTGGVSSDNFGLGSTVEGGFPNSLGASLGGGGLQANANLGLFQIPISASFLNPTGGAGGAGGATTVNYSPTTGEGSLVGGPITIGGSGGNGGSASIFGSPSSGSGNGGGDIVTENNSNTFVPPDLFSPFASPTNLATSPSGSAMSSPNIPGYTPAQMISGGSPVTGNVSPAAGPSSGMSPSLLMSSLAQGTNPSGGGWNVLPGQQPQGSSPSGGNQPPSLADELRGYSQPTVVGGPRSMAGLSPSGSPMLAGGVSVNDMLAQDPSSLLASNNIPGIGNAPASGDGMNPQARADWRKSGMAPIPAPKDQPSMLSDKSPNMIPLGAQNPQEIGKQIGAPIQPTKLANAQTPPSELAKMHIEQIKQFLEQLKTKYPEAKTFNDAIVMAQLAHQEANKWEQARTQRINEYNRTDNLKERNRNAAAVAQPSWTPMSTYAQRVNAIRMQIEQASLAEATNRAGYYKDLAKQYNDEATTIAAEDGHRLQTYNSELKAGLDAINDVFKNYAEGNKNLDNSTVELWKGQADANKEGFHIHNQANTNITSAYKAETERGRAIDSHSLIADKRNALKKVADLNDVKAKLIQGNLADLAKDKAFKQKMQTLGLETKFMEAAGNAAKGAYGSPFVPEATKKTLDNMINQANSEADTLNREYYKTASHENGVDMSQYQSAVEQQLQRGYTVQQINDGLKPLGAKYDPESRTVQKL